MSIVLSLDLFFLIVIIGGENKKRKENLSENLRWHSSGIRRSANP